MTAETGKQDLKSLSLQQLQHVLISMGEPAYRAEQVRHSVYASDTTDFSAMTSLPKVLREKLSQRFFISRLEPVVNTVSSETDNAQTIKLLYKLSDGAHIETVLIPDLREGRKRMTVCVSSQVGCALACTFCATGYMGFSRNLTIGEITDQVLGAMQLAQARYSQRITNVVFMGMGEPLLNLERVKEAIDILSHDRYQFKIGERHITISTAGIVPGILDLAESPHKCRLAISLHSAIEEKRQAIMPIAKTYSLGELKTALQHYAHKQHKPIFIEYLLLRGINDGEDDAKALIKFARAVPCKINLIDYNPIVNINYARTDDATRDAFIRKLVEANLTVTVRRSRGRRYPCCLWATGNPNTLCKTHSFGTVGLF
ncbi:MAG: 23S rRNA (adenine(2503)-C(2))-methyltransferase RlmN [Chloroherpetonaceae bacterium]|nr:23S rRNA (adenine(2503)-C(2))-methyltransferase RlmN [Chloroherpetonaceae bacterium]